VNTDIMAESLGVDQENEIDLTDEWRLIEYSHNTDARKNLEDDYKYARINIVKAIEKQTQLMDRLTQLVSASPKISDFEILSKYTSSLAELNQDLINLDENFLEEAEDDEDGEKQSEFLTSTSILRKSKNKD